jgi:deoxyribodipyrimidine photo-lyase
MSCTLLWFRQDLRLADNPALAAALERGASILPVFIYDPKAEGRWAPGAASRWWLHHSLLRLREALESRGSKLIICRGESGEVLRELVRESGADAVYWNRRYDPLVVERDKSLKAELTTNGLDAQSFNSALLFEPHTCLAHEVEEPVKLPPKVAFSRPAKWPASMDISELGLLPGIPWDVGIQARWEPGASAAETRLEAFTRTAIDAYDVGRDDLAHDACSRLSPHLHFGELGPRQVWASVKKLSRGSGVFPSSGGSQKFLTELGWREFAHHLLFHFPHTPEKPLRPEFERFPWRSDDQGVLLRAWQKGRTGYPIVDAAMRELWATGWMANRLRMVTGSFLVKHLRLPWQRGAEWFWDTLVDADLANNTLGWQWIAGCGADASPYFRIFAPVLQGEKFDPDGAYVRRWIPELSGLDRKFIHRPWEAPEQDLRRAGITLGLNYPAPIVEHAESRNAALAAYQQMRAK